MTSPHWNFEILKPGSMKRNPVSEEFFTNLISSSKIAFSYHFSLSSVTIKGLTREDSSRFKGYIEKAGTGTGDVIDHCAAAGISPPEFIEGPDFRAVLRRPISGTTPETTSETTLETTPENLSGIEAKIIGYIRSDATVTRRIIAERLGITIEGVKYHLTALKVKLGLRHEGPTKKGRWVFDDIATKKDGAK